jgi:hypothetical protein
MTFYLVPSLDDANGTGENDGMLLVRVFADDQIDVLSVQLGNGSYTPITPLSNRTILAMGATPQYLHLAMVPPALYFSYIFLFLFTTETEAVKGPVQEDTSSQATSTPQTGETGDPGTEQPPASGSTA